MLSSKLNNEKHLETIVKQSETKIYQDNKKRKASERNLDPSKKIKKKQTKSPRKKNKKMGERKSNIIIKWHFLKILEK